MSFLDIAKAQPTTITIPNRFNKLTVGLLKSIIANLPDNMEVCFDSDQECIGTYGFYKWYVEKLINIDNDTKPNDKLVLVGGGEYPYADELEEDYDVHNS